MLTWQVCAILLAGVGGEIVTVMSWPWMAKGAKVLCIETQTGALVSLALLVFGWPVAGHNLVAALLLRA